MKGPRSLAVVALALSFVPVPSPADPPPWAPAHGWRKKNDPNYVGYSGKKWDDDYGILEGTCDAAKVGAVLGGAAGAVIGSEVAKDSPDRPVAIVVGTVLGAVIGNKIGASIGSGDRGCMGHALELAGEQKPVRWTNPQTGVSFVLTPTRNFGTRTNPCREFSALASAGAGDHGAKGKGREKHKQTRFKGAACRAGNGEWVIKS